MFISIPKEFFIPVLFSDKFELNLGNNNMEYDTRKVKAKEATHREIEEAHIRKDPKITEESEEKKKVEQEMEMDNENDGEILSEADEEYIHSEKSGE